MSSDAPVSGMGREGGNTIGREGGSAPARQQLLLLTEVMLTAVSLAAVLGLGRLFAEGSFLGPVLFNAVLAHATAAAARRARLPGPVALLIAAGVAALTIGWFQLPETLAVGLPTGETLTQARLELDEAWRTFGQVVAPAPVLPGFILASSVGIWLVAFAADTAAFRAGAVVEAAVPAATLFVFGGALGTGEHRVEISGAFLTTVLAYWLAQRSLGQASSPSWLATDARAGTGALLRAGATLGAIGVVAAMVVGPNLPGADARAVVPWRATDRDSPDSRVTISPLVDIRSRLVDQAEVEAFRVRSPRRSYWRLTSLERFDGRIWSSNRQYRPARGTLRANVDTGDSTTENVRQEFTVANLASIWLPAAFRPTRVEGTEARYDRDSNSLLTEAETASGLSYVVESAVPSLSAEQLMSVPPLAPSDVARTYTALPAGFSPAVQEQAGRIVQNATTQYEKARRLQDSFRDGSFVYDLQAPAGHSGNDLEVFLFQTKRGYCEQFAGAYAAMARAVGLPARVGVGFTPGELGDDGVYTVRGFNGHAWPEVYLDGFGWVAFEPTPGRGIPGGEAYTGVPEAQAEPSNPTAATTVPTTVPVQGAPGETTTTRPIRDLPQDAAGGESVPEPSPWGRRLLVVMAAGLAAPVLWTALLLLLRRVRRRRRRLAATSPDARVLVAWEEVTEALSRAGAPPQQWETADEYARRASQSVGVDERELRVLAGVATSATFARTGLEGPTVERATAMAADLELAADATLQRRDRLRHLLDPRPILPARRVRVDVRETIGNPTRRASS